MVVLTIATVVPNGTQHGEALAIIVFDRLACSDGIAFVPAASDTAVDYLTALSLLHCMHAAFVSYPTNLKRMRIITAFDLCSTVVSDPLRCLSQ